MQEKQTEDHAAAGEDQTVQLRLVVQQKDKGEQRTRDGQRQKAPAVYFRVADAEDVRRPVQRSISR
jgi:hypothetical protein